ncbi:MAG: carbohydrate kinase family protein [Planctomycetes bacterium]|nr:carbohydrate kinase family protein [Planctomycetota bacterium]
MAERAFDVVCAGIVVADHLCVPIDHVPDPGELVMAERLVLEIGGCASNAAVDLAKMEVASTVCGCVGADVFGRFVVERLRDHGVDASGIRIVDDADTSQTLIVNVQGQDRRFIHCFGANARFRADGIRPDLASRARVLYVGGYLLLPVLQQDELARVFQTVRAQGVQTVLDVAVPGRLGGRQGHLLSELSQVLPFTDVFLPNEDEARLITGRSDPLDQAQVFLEAGAGTVVITQGDDGATLATEGIRLRAGVFRVPFVDGSGGGDAFDAGFICGLLRGYDPRGCLEIASALGASCVRAVGTTPGVFTRSECEAFLREQRLEIEEI